MWKPPRGSRPRTQTRRSPHLRTRLLLGFGCALFLTSLPAGRSLRAAPVPNVDAAIDAGILYLLPRTDAYRQRGDVAEGRKTAGNLALQVYALIVSGVSVEHATIQQAFQRLRKIPLNYTYTVACYALALDAAIAQLEEERSLGRTRRQAKARLGGVGASFRAPLTRTIGALVRLQNRTGAWTYGPSQERFDNSNTQFAVLGLGVAARRKIPVPHGVWASIVHHFLEEQNEDSEPVRFQLKLSRNDSPPARRTTSTWAPVGEGETTGEARGWHYSENEGRASRNMTCAGVSSLIIASRALGRRLTGATKEAVQRAIREGCGWLVKHWGFESDYYGVYSLEKVADLAHIERFGSHDWYDEVAAKLVAEQQDDGGWPNKGVHGNLPLTNTAFALLVLNRATQIFNANATSRLVATGRGARDQEQGRRHWVYVTDLDQTLHYPSLFRRVRHGAGMRVARRIGDVVAGYPQERRGDLVPPLTETLAHVTSPAVRKLLKRQIEAITGLSPRDKRSPSDWYVAWRDALKIGDAKITSHANELVEKYRHEKNIELKCTFLWALGRIRCKDAAELFIEDLKHPSEKVRKSSYAALSSLFVERPPAFDAQASSSARLTQFEAIVAWYNKHDSGS